jgi:hypothetical protein
MRRTPEVMLLFVSTSGWALFDGPPFCAEGIFSLQNFRDVRVKQRPKSLTHAIYTRG